MVKRISLVRKRPELSREEFFDRWTGEHLDWGRQLKGLQEFVIDLPFAHQPGVEPPYDGIAVTRFASVEAALAAFSVEPLHTKLMETRDDFAQSVEVMFAEEHVMVSRHDSPA